MDINVCRKYTPGSPRRLLCLPQHRLLRQESHAPITTLVDRGDIRSFAVGHAGARGCNGGDGASDGQDTSSHSLVSPGAQRSSTGHPGGAGKDPPRVGSASPAASQPLGSNRANPWCEPSLRRGAQRFPRSSGDVVYGCRRERSPRGSELPSSRRHACMNNRSSPDAGRLLCNFSRRLESLSRVLAEVTAHLSCSGREQQLCGWS